VAIAELGTDLGTKHRENDAHKRDMVEQASPPHILMRHTLLDPERPREQPRPSVGREAWPDSSSWPSPMLAEH
jgi:hypothetical protein